VALIIIVKGAERRGVESDVEKTGSSEEGCMVVGDLSEGMGWNVIDWI
jgi:hypothetical protein